MNISKVNFEDKMPDKDVRPLNYYFLQISGIVKSFEFPVFPVARL